MNLESVIVIAAGPFIGSFLGVVITRLPNGMPLAVARSRCATCETALGPRDLVPLISWLAARGRCRHCGAPISAFYPIIELAALAVAVWAAAVTAGWIMYATCALGWTLLALAAIDWRHMVLPDALTLPLIPVGLAVAAWIDVGRVADHTIGAVAGFVLFAAIGWIYARLRGRMGLGLGDAKLLAAGGAWVAWEGLGGIILIAAGSGLFVALIKGLAGNPPKPGDQLAFGPYLCLGIWIVWLYGPVVIIW